MTPPTIATNGGNVTPPPKSSLLATTTSKQDIFAASKGVTKSAFTPVTSLSKFNTSTTSANFFSARDVDDKGNVVGLADDTLSLFPKSLNLEKVLKPDLTTTVPNLTIPAFDFDSFITKDIFANIDIPNLTESVFSKLNLGNLFGGLDFGTVFKGLNNSFTKVLDGLFKSDTFTNLFKNITSAIKPSSSSSSSTYDGGRVSAEDWEKGSSAATEAVMNGDLSQMPPSAANHPNIIRALKFRESLNVANTAAQKFKGLSIIGADGKVNPDAGKQLLNIMIENREAFAAISSAEFADLLNQVDDLSLINNIKAALNVYDLVQQEESVKEQLIKNSGGHLTVDKLEALRHSGVSKADIDHELKSASNLFNTDPHVLMAHKMATHINSSTPLVYPPQVTSHPDLLAHLQKQQEQELAKA